MAEYIARSASTLHTVFLSRGTAACLLRSCYDLNLLTGWKRNSAAVWPCVFHERV